MRTGEPNSTTIIEAATLKAIARAGHAVDVDLAEPAGQHAVF